LIVELAHGRRVQRAKEAAREADRADEHAWSLRMEGFGGPAQTCPTIAQCLTVATAGWKSNAAAAKRGRACPRRHPAPAGHANLEAGTGFEEAPYLIMRSNRVASRSQRRVAATSLV
jgi:hypothetical protein